MKKKIKVWIFSDPNGNSLEFEAETYEEACVMLVADLGWGLDEEE